MQRERARAVGARSSLRVISRLSVEGWIHRFPADGEK